MSITRQLAAIMFTDIVGYTALMGKDEQKAFEILNKNRQIQKPIIEQYNGRWIKELGDGVMASFNTVSDAVNAAIRIQQACDASKEFQLRIGIHLGEVVFENDDVFGDGVNVASRIQAVAHPGSIFISEAVHDSLSNKKEFQTKFFIQQKLKNVKQPIKIYQIISDGVITATPPIAQKIKPGSKVLLLLVSMILLAGGAYLIISFFSNRGNSINEKSIAILPFTDLSPGKDQEYLSDGLADEIINSITIIKDLKVIGRTSSFQFKGKGLDAQTIGKKLNVGIVLEGSIQRSGNILRIIPRLIQVRDNRTIWSQRFDKEPKDIFAIQDAIAKNIVEKLKVTVSEFERPRLTKKETDPEVYSLYLKGLHTYKALDFDKCIEYNLQAITKDSLFAPSYAYIGLSKIWKIANSNTVADFNAIRNAKEYVNKSIKLDPNIAEGYSALALSAWIIELDFAASKLNFERSIELNPSASLIKNRYAYFLLWMANFDKAEKLGLDAIGSDPADWNGYVIVANATLNKKEFSEAGKYISEGIQLFPGNPAFPPLQIQLDFSTGHYDKVIQSINTLLKKNPSGGSDALLSLLSISYLRKGEIQASKNVLRQLQSKNPMQNSSIDYASARIYAQYKMADSCFVSLEKAFAKREPDLKLLKIDPFYDDLRKDQRYIDLYHRYGFDRYKQ